MSLPKVTQLMLGLRHTREPPHLCSTPLSLKSRWSVETEVISCAPSFLHLSSYHHPQHQDG